MAFIDIHAHLDFKDFDNDRENLKKELEEKNIIVFSNTLNPENYFKTKKLFQNSKNVKVCPGLYPKDAEKISEAEFNEYLIYLEKNKDQFPAIGEVGLDRKDLKDEKLFQIQENRFRKIIELAIKIDKPAIIHTRKAEARTLEILEEYIKKTGFNKFDLHCFSGKKRLINKIKELNIYCSIPLIILNTQSFQILVEELPTRQILVETDSPFLNPEKKRNSPLKVPLIYEKIAEIKGLDKKEIENIIFSNFQKFTG